MGRSMILAMMPSFYEKQVVHSGLDIAFPVAREVYPVFGAYLGLVSIKRALEMQRLPSSSDRRDDRIRVVSILIGRAVTKPHWSTRVDPHGFGRTQDAEAILLQKNMDRGDFCLEVLAGPEMKAGELMVLDPRVVIRQRDTGAIIYQPRVALAERNPFDGWMQHWMRACPDWPDRWIADGTWPEGETLPPYPSLVKATGDLKLYADTHDEDGGLLQSNHRSMRGNIFMEGS